MHVFDVTIATAFVTHTQYHIVDLGVGKNHVVGSPRHHLGQIICLLLLRIPGEGELFGSRFLARTAGTGRNVCQ
jgi:hypothetical protein